MAMAEDNRGPRSQWFRVSWLHRHREPPRHFVGGCSRLRRWLFRGDMTEEGCELMATLGGVVISLGNLEAVLPTRPLPSVTLIMA
ncbi:MAG TPA: hypothetical protein VE267_18840 [Bradyrhizobium sp.]|nr:hypothetical protein [Bradyrhizobium sp.]